MGVNTAETSAASLVPRLAALITLAYPKYGTRLPYERVADTEQRQQILGKVVAQSIEVRDERRKARLTTF